MLPESQAGPSGKYREPAGCSDPAKEQKKVSNFCVKLELDLGAEPVKILESQAFCFWPLTLGQPHSEGVSLVAAL